MSWQAGSVRAAGDRAGLPGSRGTAGPADARIVALVGTLAAFGALGRIAFAAVPNVKPTTDIVLVSGYALGAGPGFAVGAIAGLTSNFFFGQGPWTPWQMAAWGATGLIGAGLARLMALRAGDPPPPLGPLAAGGHLLRRRLCLHRRPGRRRLGHLQRSQRGGSWGSTSGKGLGFDAIHAAGCLVFALAFGPALTRSVQRFARRIQVTWVSPGGAVVPVVLVAVAVLGGRVPAARAAAVAPVSVRSSAAAYLLAAENPDGGFGAAPGQTSASSTPAGPRSDWRRPAMTSTASPTGPGSWPTSPPGPARADPGSLERTILVVRAAGLSARRFGGRDLVAELEHDVRRDGSVADQVNWTAFDVLALRAAGVARRPHPALAAGPARRRRRVRFRRRGHNQRRRRHRRRARGPGRRPGRRCGHRPGGRVFCAVSRIATAASRRSRGMGSNAQSTAWAIPGLRRRGRRPAAAAPRAGARVATGVSPG